MTLNLSNIITGIGVFFIQDKVNGMIKSTVEGIVNKQVRKQLKSRVKDQFGDSDALDSVTATVLSSNIIEDGTTTVNPSVGPPMTIPVNKLQLIVDISIPSELITGAVSGRTGCLGTVLFFAAGITISALMLIFA